MNLYLGLLSGTSMDAIDCALVSFAGDEPMLHAYREFPFPTAIRTPLEATKGRAHLLPVVEMASMDVAFGAALAEAALALLAEAGYSPADVAAIGSHGQTVLHQPDAHPPYTVQIGDPNVIAARTGIPTVADFRRMDVALGGQGAPLLPAFHAACFQTPARDRVILNLGGIANLTVLPADPSAPVFGFDTGPGNCLLDEWVMRHRGTHYDASGAFGATGREDPELLAKLMEDEYIWRPPPKSTGRDYFHVGWLEARIASVGREIAPADVQATLVGLTAESVGTAIRVCGLEPGTEILACGGGAKNTPLLARLAAALPNYSVGTTEASGIHPDAVEAVAFAWLAMRRLKGLAGNLPMVTGASRPAVLGGLYAPTPVPAVEPPATPGKPAAKGRPATAKAEAPKKEEVKAAPGIKAEKGKKPPKKRR
jgi:anhydro-N-acetylmuramic acid kinase